MKPNKLNIFLDLMQIVERGFIYKLKQRQPTLTETEVKKEVEKWYLSRDSEEELPPNNELGDLSRFTR